MEIRCSKISKAFGGTVALDELEVEFPTSGVVSLVGPNGAGKTTLLNILTGFQHPDSGSCFIRNVNISRRRPSAIAQLGVARTFQEARLIRDVSVIENVIFARPRQAGEHLGRAVLGVGLRDEESRNLRAAEGILTFVGLSDVRNMRSQDVSYGQQKLLSLACAVATESRILLLDEPVSGVDPPMRRKIIDLLRRLQDDHRLILFIEHDLDAVKAASNLVFVMDRGRVIEQGHPEEVLARDTVLSAYLHATRQ